jgi:DNA-binding HxlR family transcriptional regulator
MPEPISPVCSRFHRAVELIGSRWTGAIIQTLLQGTTRYALIKALETEGVVTRRVIPESPVRVEYELTEKGRSLKRSLVEIGSWAERWIPADAESGPTDQKPGAREAVGSARFPRTERGPRIRAR